MLSSYLTVHHLHVDFRDVLPYAKAIPRCPVGVTGDIAALPTALCSQQLGYKVFRLSDEYNRLEAGKDSISCSHRKYGRRSKTSSSGTTPQRIRVLGCYYLGIEQSKEAL